MKALTLGVLNIQGDIEEHLSTLRFALRRKHLEGEVTSVKCLVDVQKLDALTIPGGESTVIGKLLHIKKMFEQIKSRIDDGLPVLGSCAGLVMLAKKTYDRVVGETGQPLLEAMDIVVERNAFGRQRESFEADLTIPVLGGKPFHGVFIRSPSVREASPKVEVLARLNDVIVAVRQGNLIGTAFHPELGDDLRFHEYFLDIVDRGRY